MLFRSINKPSDIVVYPKAAHQIRRCLEEGWLVAYISNQGGIAAGFTTERDFNLGVGETNLQLGLDKWQIKAFYCPHTIDAGCFCRKPGTALVIRAVSHLLCEPWPTERADRRRCLFVGDRKEDRLCAEHCGIAYMKADKWRGLAVSLNDLNLQDLGFVGEEDK